MRFSAIFVSALLPLAVVTTPATGDAKVPIGKLTDGKTSAAPATQLFYLTESDIANMALVPRQDMGGVLSGLKDILGALKGILNAEFLDDLGLIVNKGAELLQDPFVNQTRDLINTVSNLLGAITPLLGSLGSLNLGSLLSSLAPLLGAVGNLLTVDNINALGDILKQAHNLLTEQFVNQTKNLIGDIEPLVSSLSQFISVLIGSVLGGGGGGGGNGSYKIV